MTYLTVKWLHILSSTILFGTGIGSAYYMLFASRMNRDPKVAAAVVSLVVWADAVFTTTTMVFQPLSGFYLAHLAGFPLGSTWIVWSVILYVVAGACWLPVVWMQIRIRNLAREAVRLGTPLPDAYWRHLNHWTLLGFPALFAFIGVFYLMVAKPA